MPADTRPGSTIYRLLDDDDDKGDDDDDGYKDDATWEYDIYDDDDGWYMRPTSVLPFFAAKCRDD